MPRYYFDAEDGGQFCDPEGTELADFNAAQLEAYRIVCQLLPLKIAHLASGAAFTVTVSNADRLALMRVDVTSTLSPAGASGAKP
jgi:hypothetical protein